MLPVIGIDSGYDFTKTSEGFIIPSRISKKEKIMGKENQVIIDGALYVVGEGEIEVNINKINTELTKACIMYSIINSTPSDDINLVLGLPIGQFKKQKDELKEMILDNRITDIKASTGERVLAIHDVAVFPQAAVALFDDEYYPDVIILDIGGRTIDIACFETISGKRIMTNYSTIYEGTLSLYDKIIKAVNNELGLSLKLYDAEKILVQGLEIYGERQDVGFLKCIIEEHIDKIMNELILNYPVQTTPVKLIGGGALLLGSPLKKRIPNLRIANNPQITNAKCFKKVGMTLWQ